MHAQERTQETLLIPERLGIAALTREAFAGKNLSRIASNLLISASRDSNNAATLMDLSVIEQLKGNLHGGLDYQAAALEKCQLYQTSPTGEVNLRVLVLAAPIHMGGNTPIEFLLKDSNVQIFTYYVMPDADLPTPLPEHDLVFIAAPGDSGATLQFLQAIDRQIENFKHPIINHPQNIGHLERDQLCHLLADVSGLIAPRTTRFSRGELLSVARGESDRTRAVKLEGFPLILRPVGSHAGQFLDRISDPTDLQRYLNECPEPDFFVTPFVDYRSDDGQYRKYRIVFVDGQSFPCHMAIADQWAVWYMNAEMAKEASKRDEEEQFMTCFDREFGMRHQEALSELAQCVGLEYFGIDCAEDKNGNLVVFEADNALVVHDMDCETLYPYKKPQMQKIFEAFEACLQAKSTPAP